MFHRFVTFVHKSSDFEIAFVAPIPFWSSTIVPGPRFDSYLVDVLRYFSVVDPVGPVRPKTRQDILSMDAVTLSLYSLVIQHSHKSRFVLPQEKNHARDRWSEVLYEVNDCFGGTLHDSRDSSATFIYR